MAADNRDAGRKLISDVSGGNRTRSGFYEQHEPAEEQGRDLGDASTRRAFIIHFI